MLYSLIAFLRLFSENSKKVATIPTTVAATTQRIGTAILDSEVIPTSVVGKGTEEGTEVG